MILGLLEGGFFDEVEQSPLGREGRPPPVLNQLAVPLLVSGAAAADRSSRSAAGPPRAPRLFRRPPLPYGTSRTAPKRVNCGRCRAGRPTNPDLMMMDGLLLDHEGGLLLRWGSPFPRWRRSSSRSFGNDTSIKNGVLARRLRGCRWPISFGRRRRRPLCRCTSSRNVELVARRRPRRRAGRRLALVIRWRRVARRGPEKVCRAARASVP